jgi:hypothetical protein
LTFLRRTWILFKDLSNQRSSEQNDQL